MTYEQQLRRIDRLCTDQRGRFEWLRGTSSAWTPTAPVVPDDMLHLASIYQTWDENRRVVQDAVKVVPMNELVGERQRVDAVVMDLAELRLALNAQGMDSGIKKGNLCRPIPERQPARGAGANRRHRQGALQLPHAHRAPAGPEHQ